MNRFYFNQRGQRTGIDQKAFAIAAYHALLLGSAIRKQNLAISSQPHPPKVEKQVPGVR